MKMYWFVIILVLLWAMWVVTGGPQKIENHNAPFLEQPNPIETGRVYTLEELRERNMR